MPVWPGEHTDVLRAIGRLLDLEGADGVHVVHGQGSLTVEWRSGVRSDHRRYEGHHLAELRKSARGSRGELNKGPDGGWADLLRTLGQDMDRDEIGLAELTHEADNLTVTGSVAGRPTSRTYSIPDLRASSQRRQAWRRATDDPPTGADSPGEQAPTRKSGITRPPDDEGPLSRRLRSD